jgi:phenylacetate-coenzyme A ligase PaaK-like adenylate-forming protein
LSYKKILDVLGFNPDIITAPYDYPMLPVRLFKEYALLSVEKKDIIKTVISSGTTGQNPSRIFLDKETAQKQRRVGMEMYGSFFGKRRLPLIILDSPVIGSANALFSVRRAIAMGNMFLGSDIIFALDENMAIAADKISEFLKKHEHETILFFGMTFIIWQHIVDAMRALNLRFKVEKGILFHGGGWKKLINLQVDSETFKQAICDVIGSVEIHDTYGMSEQLGTAFIECEYGHMHCPIFSDVFVRRFNDFACAGFGERGFLEILQLLPTSYPGHILLTEDEGEILGEDDCPCGRLGKYIKIHGRIKGAEIRGCSDTYEQR